MSDATLFFVFLFLILMIVCCRSLVSICTEIGKLHNALDQTNETLKQMSETLKLFKRDTFDYTEWQRERWSDKSIEEIHALATEHEKNNAK